MRLIFLLCVLMLSSVELGAQDLLTALEVQPAEVVLVPEVPKQLHILSLSNSLTSFSRQDELFVEMAKSKGISAEWIAHSLTSSSLFTHWQEGPLLAADGLPGAQQLVRSYPWTHIILQDHSQMPLDYRNDFLNNIEQWVNYIRRECPNPNVVIILPMSWVYSWDLNNIDASTELLHEPFREAAYRTASTVCPIGEAYRQVLETLGDSVAQELYVDDRHPTGLAGYMAAAMELSLMTGIRPTTIEWCPDTIDATLAKKVKDIADSVLSSYDNVVDHLRNKVHFRACSMNAQGVISDVTQLSSWNVVGDGRMQGATFMGAQQLGEAVVDVHVFNLDGKAIVKISDYVVPEPNELPCVAISDEVASVTEDFNTMSGGNALPVGWRIDGQQKAYGCVGDYAMATDTVDYIGGANISLSERGWTACLEASQPGDCAVGGMAASFSGCPVGINVYVRFVNEGQVPLYHLDLSYDVEKYRNGSNPVGTEARLYYSRDGKSWVSAGGGFTAHWDADANNMGSSVVPIYTRRVAHHLHGIEIEPGEAFYLAWNIGPSVPGSASRTMALGIDNVTLSVSRRGVGLETITSSAEAMRIDGDALVGYGRIEIFDIQGRLVVAGRQMVPLDSLPVGIYIARDQAGHTLKLHR